MPEDKKPKSEDTKRDKDVGPAQNQAGADRDLQDRRQSQFGDHTSSSAAANNPGQHGRDGGEINETPNNPPPSEEAVKGDVATAEAARAVEEAEETTTTEKQPEVKKL